MTWFDLDGRADIGALTTVLDDHERGRAARFPSQLNRDRFVVAHAITRLTLAGLTGLDPARLQLSAGTHGKPRLEGAGVDLRFNLSHSHNRALLAVARGREVGVDLERARPVDVLGLARRFFSAGEFAAVSALAPDERQTAFFRCFTRKEAFVKAVGLGLALPLNSFDIGIDTATSEQTHSRDSRPSTWTIVSLDAGDGYAAAVAAEGRGWTVEHYDSTEPEFPPHENRRT